MMTTMVDGSSNHLIRVVTFIGILLLNHAATCSAFHKMTGRVLVNRQRSYNTLPAEALLCPQQNTESSGIHVQDQCAVGSQTETSALFSVSSRRSMIVSSIAFLTVTSHTAIKANADVSDGNSLPQGAQQFARTIKLRTDLKDVTKRLLTASDDNSIDKKEWDNISKFLRTVYSTADNDMKTIAKGLSYNPPNQKQANNDVDEIKKYAQAGDVSASKQDATRLASILTKISELLEDFISSLSDVPDEI